MIKSEELKKIFLSLGAKEEEIEPILKDVSRVILKKTIIAQYEKLDDKTKEKLNNIPDEKLKSYLEENKDLLPELLPKEEIEKIAKETWESYFEAMKK